MHGLQLSLWVVVVFHKVWTELSMPLTVRVSLLWRAWFLDFWVRWMPRLHLVLKESSAPFLKYAYPGNEKDENLIVPCLANLFHVALSEKRIPAYWKKPRSPPFKKKALSLIPTTAACWLWVGLCIDCSPTFWENWWPSGVLRTEKFLTRNLAFIQTVARSSLCLF